SRIGEGMTREVEVARFFEAPTTAKMARHLATLMEPRKPRRASLAIARAARKYGAPASVAQERLWEFQHALPDLPFLNILYALRVTSSVEVAVLERSINDIVRRHDILRTTFASRDGRPVQVIAAQLTVPPPFHHLPSFSAPKA